MKKFSKIMSSALALAMVACMSTTAFAAGPAANAEGTTIDSLTGKETVDVQLAAEIGEEAPVYNINVAWTSMEFNYTYTAPVWNPTDHTRTAGSGEWSNKGEATITVINHSNVPVDVSNSYAPEVAGQYVSGTAYNGVTVTLADFGTNKLQAGVENEPKGTDGTDKTTCKLTVTGKPDETIAQGVVGHITVQLTAGTYSPEP